MRISILLIFFVIQVFTVYSCGSSDGTTLILDHYIKTGAYYYFQLSDSINQPLIEGKFKVVYINNGNLSGIYEISKKFSDSFSGFNMNNGTFTGTESSDKNRVFMNMNPKISDNNIFLDFNVSNEKLEGIWYHSTMLGKKAEGKLSGKKID